MTSRLIHLMRHGAPEQSGLMLGRTDAAPLPSGIADCMARANALSFAAIVSSDLQRASAPAAAIAQARGISASIDPRWREMDFGQWDGLAASQIDGAALSLFWQDPDLNPPPEGERWSSLQSRVGQAIAALPHSDTLVLTHGGAMRAALSHLFGFGLGQCWAFDLPYGATLSLRCWGDGSPGNWQLVGLTT